MASMQLAMGLKALLLQYTNIKVHSQDLFQETLHTQQLLHRLDRNLDQFALQGQHSHFEIRNFLLTLINK